MTQMRAPPVEGPRRDAVYASVHSLYYCSHKIHAIGGKKIARF